MYTHLEDYIYLLLKSLDITKPHQLNIENVSNRMGLKLVYKKKAFMHDDEIVLQPGTRQKEWVLFVHELCHRLRHAGMQLIMHPLFVELQEYQADYFSYHFCVPTFMLQELKEVSVHVIMNLFNVEEDFAIKRFEMYQNKLINGRVYSALQTSQT